MRSVGLCCLFIASSLLAQSVAQAETKEPLVIDRVRIGFPGAQNEDLSRYKAGFWAPVYIDLTVGPQDIPIDAKNEIIVETTDSDDIQNEYRQPLRSLTKGSSVTEMTYVRPGNGGSEITVTIRIGDRVFKKKGDRETDDVVNPDGTLYLVLGAKLPGLRRALTPRPNPAQPGGDVVDEDPEDTRQLRFADIQQVEQMPTRWFGYHAVDVVVLPSGNEAFIKRLSEDRGGRPEALAEWVRRGGRILIAAGRNQQFVQELLDKKMKLLNCGITGTVKRPQLSSLQQLTGSRLAHPDGIEISKLAPGAGVDIVKGTAESPDAKDREMRPILVESACGLGHVLLVACDIDMPPFTGWAGQKAFWLKVQEMLEPPLAQRPDPALGNWMGEDRQELASRMQDSLESFGDITVISFGWVALFILLYIIVVGPLDYLFLKKVVKRLEWTWVTFPAVVLLVSAMAYFTAYWLKGNDLKIQKIDIVDIDLNPPLDDKDPRPQVYGSTWFTLFSPRIQNYTIGIEPAEPGWGGAGQDKSDNSPLVGWMGRPETGFGGTGRTGSQSLFKRTYEYAENATALKDVPIQVWATKSFSASWEIPGSPQSPPVSADLSHAPGRPNQIIGSITSHLPVELQDVVLFHGDNQLGNCYFLDRLSPDVPARIDNLEVGVGKSKGLGDWLRQPFADQAPATPAKSSKSGQAVGDFASLLKPILFNKAAADQTLRNTTLRTLDQSWRLKRPEEVVLFGRVDPRAGEGPAEKITQDGVSPSRLWLGVEPGSGKNRPKLVGTITQRTYVRVYIPVKPQK
jgi:hypothetical protein